MHILIIALDFKPLTGGVAEYTHQVAHHLHLAGDKVTVLSKRIEGDKKFDAICPYDVKRYNYDKIKFSRIWRFQAIWYAVQRQDPDLILVNHLASEANLSWLTAKLLSIPYCIIAYGKEVNKGNDSRAGINERLRRYKRSLAFRKADKVFCITLFTRKVLENLGISPTKTAIVYPGIAIKNLNLSPDNSISSLPQSLRSSNKKVILTLSRLVERKGIDKTIQAMKFVSKKIPEVVYIIAGDGPYRDSLELLVDKANLQNNVIFTGYVPEEHKSAYYKAADLFVMPNRELEDGDVEGFGIVFLEANAFGKPVIGGRSGGAVEAIIDGATGLLVNPRDVDEIASEIIRLLKDKELARRLGEQGKERVEKDFNWKHLVAGLRTELQEIIR